MGNCKFNVDFNESIGTLIGKAKSAVMKVDGTFSGDNESGMYALPTPLGMITGNYTVSGNTIEFQITDKPFLVSCNKIEGELRKYLGAAA